LKGRTRTVERPEDKRFSVIEQTRRTKKRPSHHACAPAPAPAPAPACFPARTHAHTLPGVSAVAIALGLGHTCVIASGGGVKCWGYNSNGQLGINSTVDATRPANVTGARPPPFAPLPVSIPKKYWIYDCIFLGFLGFLRDCSILATTVLECPTLSRNVPILRTFIVYVVSIAQSSDLT
jgi:hypothetical protein